VSNNSKRRVAKEKNHIKLNRNQNKKPMEIETTKERKNHPKRGTKSQTRRA